MRNSFARSKKMLHNVEYKILNIECECTILADIQIIGLHCKYFLSINYYTNKYKSILLSYLNVERKLYKYNLQCNDYYITKV